MLKITTFFKNRVVTTNLIFRDAENKGVNVIYYPELGNSGINFINKYRKKNYWDYVIIPMTFTFLFHKIYTNNYYKSFKKAIPMIRIQRRFMKNSNESKSTVIDLTPLSENFTAFSKSRSKKMTMEAFFELIQKFAEDSKATGKDTYLVIDSSIGDESEMAEAIHYYSRLNGNKLRINGIEGIALYGAKRFWPLTIKDEDKEGTFFKINMSIFTRFMKEVHNSEIEEEQTPEEAIEDTKNTVKALYELHKEQLRSAVNDISGITKKSDNIEENPLELIKNEVIRNPHIKGKSFEEKLSNLFNEKTDQSGPDKKSKEVKIVSEISEELEKLQKQYNGAIELNESTVLKNTKTFYNPFNIIGFKTFNAYNKQDTEFGENLDQAIFDLIKSIEADKEVGIKVLNIRTEITDTNRDRYKTYKIKLQHKDFGHSKPYTVSFHVPIPSKGKYLKLGGNDWIMINQFFPKPVIKVAPQTVRLYTHYGTAAVILKTHVFNENEGVKDLLNNFEQSLKRTKKLKKAPEKISEEKINNIKEKYNLPEFINSDIFTNIEIK